MPGILVLMITCIGCGLRSTADRCLAPCARHGSMTHPNGQKCAHAYLFRPFLIAVCAVLKAKPLVLRLKTVHTATSLSLFCAVKRIVAPIGWPATDCLNRRHAWSVVNIFYCRTVLLYRDDIVFWVVLCVSLHSDRLHPSSAGRFPVFVFAPFVHVRLSHCAL